MLFSHINYTKILLKYYYYRTKQSYTNNYLFIFNYNRGLSPINNTIGPNI